MVVDGVDQSHAVFEVLAVGYELVKSVLKLVVFLVDGLDPPEDGHLVG